MKCKKCGAEFDGNVCPYCCENQIENAFIENASIKTEEMLNKSQKQKKPIYKKWWFWVIAVLVIFGVIGSFGNEPSINDEMSMPYKNDVTTTEELTSELLIKETTESTIKNEEIIFAEDVVVNRFINEFNNSTKYEMTDISKGNIRTKFFAVANGCYIEMINANDAYADCFSISINGGQEIQDRDRMFDVFSETLKVLDPTITTDKIAQTVNYLKNEQYMVSDYKVTDKITIETYVPIIELSYGKSACRIDVISSDYR